jgi:sirohydrochlorin cobaltochelatase
MNQTILLVGHGSRGPDGNRETEEFARLWRERHPDWRIDLCYIEFDEVLLDAGLDRAAEGSQRVLVMPFILNAAGHVKMEIPEAIEGARLRHPQVEFLYGRHLGMGRTMLGVLENELKSAMKSLDFPDPKTTGVILLGRGSSDAGANGEIAKIARWLFEATEHELVDIAFTGITFPRLETTVSRMQRLDMTQIVVLPVYLFTGVLIERIQRQVERLGRQYPQIAFGLGHHLGFDEEIFRLLDRRVAGLRGEEGGARMLECDGCKYREMAHEHEEHHHH